ncbi:hypothetical protein PYW07_005635 [Mythimna separata]|uniref:GST C-terminal domain-containing protein n=1 Tax=Mythimna separata TaxID=271217 RepID=A0AAD8DS94_MYTSE|nr:hypothetical protein PYW07_005635 [Mythimna separata]
MKIPIWFLGDKEIKKPLKDDLNATLSLLNLFLNDSKWVAGDHPTIADTSIYASVSSILAVGWDISGFLNIERWVNDCSALPGAAENDIGLCL